MIENATEDEQYQQRWLDWVLRPRSVETWPEYQGLLARPTRLGHGWTHLPGEPAMKRRR